MPASKKSWTCPRCDQVLVLQGKGGHSAMHYRGQPCERDDCRKGAHRLGSDGKIYCYLHGPYGPRGQDNT